MRILYHHRTQGKRVEGIHIRELIKALKDLGHEVIVVSPPGVDPLKDENYQPDSSLKMASFWKWLSKVAPQIVFELLELSYNLTAYKKMRDVIKKEKIDFLYERYAFFSFAGSALAAKYKLPFILEVNEVSGIKRVRGQILVGLCKKLERKIFGRAQALVVVSSFLKEQIGELGIALAKIQVIPNAVDIAKFSPKENGAAAKTLKDKVVLGFIGSFVKWHNFEFLLESFSEIVQENSQKEIQLLLIGDGPMKDEIIAIVEKKGLQGSVVLAGSVTHSQVPEYLDKMDICLIPSSNAFRSPIKLFEYMAMAKPVIAPRLAPIEAIIKDGITGILFEPEDKIYFKKAIAGLINDQEKRARIGKEARNTVLAKHLWRHNAEQVLQIYQNVKQLPA